MIPFNKPYLTGKELKYIKEAVNTGKISGNGKFTQLCQRFFEEKYGFKKCLLTTSCTDALEMAAILCDIQPGDEVIVPAYTFVSTANAFVLRGAKIVFADCHPDHPGIDESRIENLVTSRTKVIVPVHYSGIACNMDVIMDIAARHNILVVEDAAQSLDSYYNGKPLGGIGHLGCLSFHETKNIQCGEGGMLIINDEIYFKRAEIIWEKGTNRAEYFRGEVNKYGWVDIGSSFLPSEITAAFLYAQLLNIEKIQRKRLRMWSQYFTGLEKLNSVFGLPSIPAYSTNNAHMFYLVCKSLEHRTELIDHLKENGIMAVFHYLNLQKSDFYSRYQEITNMKNTDRFSDCLVRLPLHYELKTESVKRIIYEIEIFVSRCEK